MNIDKYIINLAVFIVPGYIGYLFYCKLRSNSHLNYKNHPWISIFNIFTFTIVSYLFFELINSIISIFDNVHRESEFIRLVNQNDSLLPKEIVYLVFISILLGVILAIIENYNLITRIFTFLKVTNVSAREDVWSYCVKNKAFEWVYIRDFSKNLLYYGHIDKYSLTDDKREVLMTTVDVFQIDNSVKIYSCDYLYLSCGDFDITLETNPQINIKEKENG